MLFRPMRSHKPITAKVGMVRFGHLARYRAMIGICALRPAGVDVKLPLQIAAADVALGLSRCPRLKERQLPSPDLSQQGAGVAHVPCGLSALDRGEDRLQQRARIVGRSCLAP